ncbi:MAG TPA: hypothetical protein VFW38_03185 [Solirubrobacteraceae bacterium]|nr:hypothetical protein [Solirubrobacteraceae bacterium]
MDWTALVGVVAAVIAAVCAFVALAWSRSEHNEFLRRMRARARFVITLQAIMSEPAVEVDDPLAVSAAAGQAFEQMLEIGLTNTGDGAAGPTVVNVLVPAYVRVFVWTTAGSRVTSDQRDSRETEETLTQGDREVPSRWISCEVPRVSTRTPVLLHFRLNVDAFAQRVPVRVKVQCDELPDDVYEVVKDFELTVYEDVPPYRLRGENGQVL